MKLLVSIWFGLSLATLCQASPCPEPSATQRYVIAPLRSEDERKDSEKDKILIHYGLLAPYDNQKPTLLMLNGGPGGDYHIISLLKNTSLAEKMNIVSFDHRGVGCTKVLSTALDYYEPGIYSMARASADLEVIRRDLLGENGSWFVYGISYGTMLGQKYATLYPDHILGIILDSAFHESKALQIGRNQFIPLFVLEDDTIRSLYEKTLSLYPDLKIQILRNIRPMVYSYLGRHNSVTDYLKRILSASSKEEATKIIESQWAPLIGMARNILCEEIWDYPEVPEQEQYFFWELATECKPFVQHRTQMDFRDALTRLKVKTFIWGGRFDPVTPLQAMKEMRQLIPNSALWENVHAGHGLITEKDKCALDLAEKFMLTQLSLQELEQEAHRTDCQSPPQQRSSFSKLAVQVLKNSGVYPALFR